MDWAIFVFVALAMNRLMVRSRCSMRRCWLR